MNEVVLVVPDLHEPYAHRDAFRFLEYVVKEFAPTKIVLLGDELDYHTISFHDKDPDTQFSPSSELTESIKRMKKYYELFPEATVVESNHGSLVYRKQKYHGLPRSVFRDYKEILEAPEGWRWKYEEKIGNTLFRHQFNSNIGSAIKAHGCNVVQGHFHTRFELKYEKIGNSVFFGASVGCLIDKNSLAFGYAKTNLEDPKLGCLIIVNDLPILVSMILKPNGRWEGI